MLSWLFQELESRIFILIGQKVSNWESSLVEQRLIQNRTDAPSKKGVSSFSSSLRSSSTGTSSGHAPPPIIFLFTCTVLNIPAVYTSVVARQLRNMTSKDKLALYCIILYYYKCIVCDWTVYLKWLFFHKPYESNPGCWDCWDLRAQSHLKLCNTFIQLVVSSGLIYIPHFKSSISVTFHFPHGILLEWSPSLVLHR